MGIYTMVYPYYAAEDYDAWIAKFMADNRKERIENDIPWSLSQASQPGY